MSATSRAPAAKDDAKGYLVTPLPPTPFGKYTVIGKLGHGGMAEVNLAVVGGKAGFRKLFVLKRLHAHLEAEQGFIDMFLDEARLAAQLDHPNCVQTVEVGEAAGSAASGLATQHFLAMEYLDGQGLERLLRITGQRGDILPIHTSVRMIADALDGLGYAHDLRGYDGTPLGVVHRDVSPQNIFVTYTGVVKLLDFGIAKAESNVVETRTGVVKGKYAYIAPEQALAAPVDLRADLWSMGVVLWEMLTSRRLFKSVNELATLNETLRGEIHPPSKYNPAIPPELDAVVLRALQREVDQRYRTAHEFKDALEGWLDTQPEPSDRKAIAALMKDRFGDILEQHKERLRECIASVASDPRSLDRLVLGGLSSSSTSMEADAYASGSHPPIPVDSGARLAPGGAHGMTPTPSPRPRLGHSVSGSITAGLPAMDDIAPRISSPGHPSPVHASGMHASGMHASGMHPTTSSSGMHSGAYTPAPGYAPSSGYAPMGPEGHVTSSSEWAMGSHPGVAPQPVAPASFAAEPTMRVPSRRSRTRSVGWWLFGAAACAASAVLAVVLWTTLHRDIDPAGTAIALGPSPASPGTTSPGATSPGTATPEATAAQPGSTGLLTTPTTEVQDPTTAPGEPTGTSTNPTGRDDRTRRRPGRDDTRGTEPAVAAVTPQPQPADPTPTASDPAHGPGYLSLVTSPWTNVTLDGRSLGDTPLVRVSLPAGSHTLRLRNAEAGIDETYEVTIRAGETTSRRLGLR